MSLLSVAKRKQITNGFYQYTNIDSVYGTVIRDKTNRIYTCVESGSGYIYASTPGATPTITTANLMTKLGSTTSTTTSLAIDGTGRIFFAKANGNIMAINDPSTWTGTSYDSNFGGNLFTNFYSLSTNPSGNVVMGINTSYTTLAVFIYNVPYFGGWREFDISVSTLFNDGTTSQLSWTACTPTSGTFYVGASAQLGSAGPLFVKLTVDVNTGSVSYQKFTIDSTSTPNNAVNFETVYFSTDTKAYVVYKYNFSDPSGPCYYLKTVTVDNTGQNVITLSGDIQKLFSASQGGAIRNNRVIAVGTASDETKNLIFMSRQIGYGTITSPVSFYY